MEVFESPRINLISIRLTRAQEKARRQARGMAEIPEPPRKTARELRIESFRMACKWILPRLSELLEAGWTLKALFAPGHGRKRLWGSGIAWCGVWSNSGEISLESDGSISFKIFEAMRTVTQTAYPPGNSN